MATITTLNNNIPGVTFRETINSNFTSLNNGKAETSAVTSVEARVTVNEGDIETLQTDLTEGIDTLTTVTNTNTSNITTLQNEVETLQDDVAALTYPTISVYSGTLGAQSVVVDTPEILSCMTGTLVNSDNTIFDKVANTITILEAGIYKICGTLNISAPINDLLKITTYVDNLPTSFSATAIGRGNGVPVTISFTGMSAYSVNDELELWVESSGTSVTVETFTMVLEKTQFTL